MKILSIKGMIFLLSLTACFVQAGESAKYTIVFDNKFACFGAIVGLGSVPLVLDSISKSVKDPLLTLLEGLDRLTIERTGRLAALIRPLYRAPAIVVSMYVGCKLGSMLDHRTAR